MGNWPVATWCFCVALTLIISMVELCKLRSWLAVSGTTSSTPTPTTPPSSASQPASSTPSPAPNSCLVSLIRTCCRCCCVSCLASLLCITDVAWTWVRYVSARFAATFTLSQACGRCWRPSWPVSSSPSSQHLPVPAPAGPGVAITSSASSQQPWPRC